MIARSAGRDSCPARGRLGFLLALPIVVALSVVAPTTVAAQEPVPDLSSVTITLDDLPDGFAASEDAAASYLDIVHAVAGGLPASPDASEHNPVLYQRSAGTEVEAVVSVLIAPLSEADQAAFDASATQAVRLVSEQAADLFGDGTVTVIEGMATGESRLALRITSQEQGFTYETVIARRDAVIESVGHAWRDGTTTTVTLEDLARVLDGRLAAVVGVAPPVYRPTGPLVAPLTTHIPTPLDVSTNPAVVGTNVVLTALALLLLTISAKLATRMLAEHEDAIARRMPGSGTIGRVKSAVGRRLGPGGRTGRLRDALRLSVILTFYGLVFSLLEPTWNPLTTAGIWLFLSFLVANAVVGMADDLVQWRVARRWGLPADVAVRPSNAALAVASTGVSRVAAVVPGLMFGTPEALQFDEGILEPPRARRLVMIGFVTLVAVGVACWAATIATAAASRAAPVPAIVGGLQALLLVMFAAAVQNMFVSLLGLRGSVGDHLRRSSPVAWGAALAAVTFVFWHTLLNPQGDPAIALSNRNVQVTMGLVVVFTVATLAAWMILRLASAGQATALLGPVPMAGDAVTVGDATTPVPVPTAVPPPTPAPTVPQLPPAIVVAPPTSPALPPAGPVLAPAGVPGAELSIRTTDGRARGRARFTVSGDWVTTRTELIDPRASRQYRAFVLLSLLAWLVPFGVRAVAVADTPATSTLAVGFMVVVAWLVVVVLGRAWLERYRVVHTTTFPRRAVAAVDIGRDWALGCALAILLTPLLGLLYLVLARGRVIRVVAPLAADRPGPMSLRLKGSEAEGLLLRRLLLGA